MCTVPPTTERSIKAPADIVGLACPLCDSPERIGYMKFLDPHGVERVDPQIFECSARRHSFTLSGGKLRLLASDGTRPRTPRLFYKDGEVLAECS